MLYMVVTLGEKHKQRINAIELGLSAKPAIKRYRGYELKFSGNEIKKWTTDNRDEWKYVREMK